MIVYMLVDPNPYIFGNREPTPLDYIELGGGSSSPARARVYPTEERAEKMRDRYFGKRCKIVPIELPV